MLYDLGFYCDFSKVVSDAVYAKTKGIIVKSMTINEKKLYILNYEKDKITKDNVLGFFRSVITDGKRIVCFSPPKSEKYIDFMKENKYEDVKIENFVEGTMINVFYYKDEWNISTRGNIGANCKYFRDYNCPSNLFYFPFVKRFICKIYYKTFRKVCLQNNKSF